MRVASPLKRAAERGRRRAVGVGLLAWCAIAAAGASASDVIPALPGKSAREAASPWGLWSGGAVQDVRVPKVQDSVPAASCCDVGGGRCGMCGHGAHEMPGCPACCPVRPASFGFYGTQWRTWPGLAMMQAARTESEPPVMPPASEVPTADEESPVPGFEAPAPGAEDFPAEPSVPPIPDPAARDPAPAKLPEPKAPAKPDAPKAPADDNLFDEAALQKRSRASFTEVRHMAIHQERVRQQALRQQALQAQKPVGRPLTAVVAEAAEAPGRIDSGSNALRRASAAFGDTVKRASHESPPARPPQRPANPLR